jgi:hypothetical protein
VFVRTKKVGDKSYKQLVENYREDGHHRQRVVVHLGHHNSVEDALEAARRNLEALEAGDLLKDAKRADWETGNWDRQLRKYWDEGFARYHGGEIPTPEEVGRLSGDDSPAPLTDEVEYVSSFMGKTHTSYKRQRVDRTQEQHEYRKTFSFGEEFEIDPRWSPTRTGRVTQFEGAYKFDRWLEAYHHWKNRAAKKQEEYDRRESRLKERIEKLEAVVTKIR